MTIEAFDLHKPLKPMTPKIQWLYMYLNELQNDYFVLDEASFLGILYEAKFENIVMDHKSYVPLDLLDPPTNPHVVYLFIKGIT